MKSRFRRLKLFPNVMKNTIRKTLGAIILATALIGCEKPIDIVNAETSRGNFTVREFPDRYETFKPGLEHPVRKMYDYEKDGELDKLKGGPKGLASYMCGYVLPNEQHKEIYSEVFYKLKKSFGK